MLSALLAHSRDDRLAARHKDPNARPYQGIRRTQRQLNLFKIKEIIVRY